ncbi:MAG: FG-GAP repeat domain-containing protein [Planctomycetota bacterium]
MKDQGERQALPMRMARMCCSTALPLSVLVSALLCAGSLAAQGPQFRLVTPAAVAQQSFASTVVADFDGDGDADILGSSRLSNLIGCLRNDGNAGFVVLAPGVAAGFALTAFGLLPFDADGDDDLDVLVFGGTQPATILLNDGSMGFVANSAALPINTAAPDAVVLDADGDGDLDLALAGMALLGQDERLLLNDGTGSFVLGATLTPVPFGGGAVAALDLDSDGDQDLVFGGAGLRVFRNDGNLVFSDVTAAVVNLPINQQGRTIQVFDADGDGDDDLLLQGLSAPGQLVRNQGGVLVAGSTLPPKNLTTGLAVSDVDGDGDVDVLRSHEQAGLSLALNDGSGVYVDAPQRLPAQSVFSRNVQLADLDQDGDPEIVTSLPDSATLVLGNRDVDLSVASVQIGQAWPVTLRSQPGYAALARPCLLVVGLAALPLPIVVPTVGQWFVDPNAPNVQVGGAMSMTLGTAAFSFPIPASPGLVGIALEVQGVVERPAPEALRFTAWRTVVLQ